MQPKDLEPLVDLVMAEYGLTPASIRNLNHEYNSVFEIFTTSKEHFALRLGFNSARSHENLLGELSFLQFVANSGKLVVAKPIMNLNGSLVTLVNSALGSRIINCVLFEWLEGEDLGDSPAIHQLFEAGKAMALLHDLAMDFRLPEESILPRFDGFFWEVNDYLRGKSTSLTLVEQELLTRAIALIAELVENLYSTSSPILIHGDFHGWNLKWQKETVAVLDFDDCGLGLEIQDLATALYYLDSRDQDEAFLEGYKSIRRLPNYTESELAALLLQRRIQLLNYVYEVRTPELLQMREAYQAETFKRIESFLAN